MEKSGTQTLEGSVSAVLFENEDNGYRVLRLTPGGGDPVCVVGILPKCSRSEKLRVTGSWETHPTHGRQLRAETAEVLLPAGAAAIEEYLAGRAVKGIGPRTASRIVKMFGDETLSIMEKHPERLAEVPGISAQKAREIGENFSHQFGMRKLLEYFLSNGLPSSLAAPFFRAYGDLSVDALEEDPYLLTEPVFGADFATVDRYAVAHGIAAEDQRRVEAGLLATLRHNLGSGHCFIPAQQLCMATGTMLHISPEAAEEALPEMNMAERLITDTLKGRKVCYLPEYHRAEVYVSERLSSMAAAPLRVPSGLADALKKVRSESDTDYAPKQLEAITAAAQHQILLLTGGPGTGKTTTVNGILALFDALHITCALAAPTGRAAQRMEELCHRDASTIHRLLESQYSPEDDALIFTRDESDPLKADAVIVDESSMVDLLLMEALLRGMKEGSRLILVGDPDQLPSVGAGTLFADMLHSGIIPLVELTDIFRQAQESLIVMNAHAINHGQEPALDAKDRDFFFITRRDPIRCAETIADLCVRRLPQNMSIPSDEIQVLSPTRKGDTGTASLNARLQAAINPASKDKNERKYGSVIFREGDRVMQVRNNYDIVWRSSRGLGGGSGIFNGDVGRIERIDREMESMTIVFDDRIAEYSFDQLGEIELAYAMTVHKSQGSEYRAVILAVSQANPYLLSRSVLYTAVTRARELLILVGERDIVATMVGNNHHTRRYSGLRHRLAEIRQ